MATATEEPPKPSDIELGPEHDRVQAPPVGSKTVKVSIPGPRGRLNAWGRVVSVVDRSYDNGYAFEGPWVRRGSSEWLSPGTYLLLYDDVGSRRYSKPHAAVYRVTEDANLELVLDYEGDYEERKWALGIRDDLAKLFLSERRRGTLTAKEVRAGGPDEEARGIGTPSGRGSDAGPSVVRAGEGPLEAVAPEDVPRDGGERNARRDATGGGEAGARADADHAGPRGDDLGGGRGGAGVSLSPAEQELDAKVVQTVGEGTDNFVITSDTKLFSSDRFGDSIRAIELAKRLLAEHRAPTPEEKRILVRYTGWGALPQVFTDAGSPQYQRLASLLTPDELLAARRSTPNAHYTSREVVQFMWKALARLGFKGGRVLEPALGVGHFIGLAPTEWPISWVGVELEPIAGTIAQLLYPKALVHLGRFEEAVLPSNWSDVVISNVPFGGYPVDDSHLKLPNYVESTIHDFYFAKALELVRPKGVVAFITSVGTMDKRNTRVREYLAKRARLLAAFRLPTGTFWANAGTDVDTDIILLQKRDKPLDLVDDDELRRLGEPAWNSLRQDAESFEYNVYYHEHPQNLFARPSRGGRYSERHVVWVPLELSTQVERLPDTPRGRSARQMLALVESEGRDFTKEMANLLEGALERVPQGAFDEPAPEFAQPEAVERNLPAPGDETEGSLVVQEGKVYQHRGGKLVALPRTNPKMVEAYLKLPDSARRVLRLQASDVSDDELAEAQKALNRDYDAFVKKYGYLHSRRAVAALRRDADFFTLNALETNWDAEKGTAEKSPVFSQRRARYVKRPERVESLPDALVLVLSETGRVDVEQMANLLGRTVEETEAALRESGLAGPVLLGGAWPAFGRRGAGGPLATLVRRSSR